MDELETPTPQNDSAAPSAGCETSFEGNQLNTNNKRKNVVYMLMMFGITMIWGAAFPFTTLVLSKGVPVFLFLAGRFLLAGILLIAIGAFKNKTLRVEKPSLISASLIGVVMFVAYALQTFGLEYTSPDKSGLLTGLYVLFIPLMKCVIKRKFQWKPVFDALMCVAGVLVFYEIWNQSIAMNVGDFMTIGSALCFAIHILLIEKYSSRFELISFTAYQLLSLGLLALVASLATEIPQYATMDVGYFLLSSVVLGVLSSALSNLVQNYVQTKLQATTVSLIASMETVFAVLFSLAWGYAQISLWYAVGAFIIFAAIVSGCVSFKSKKEKL